MQTQFERPIFILGSHKSGTTLVRNLLDGAPGLFVVPVETHFFQFAGFGVSYALRAELPATITFDRFLERLRGHVEATNRGIGARRNTGDNDLVARWDLELFVESLALTAREPFERGDWRVVLESYIQSLHLAVNGTDLVQRRYVEKSVEHSEFVPLLKKLYPDARFVHIVRNPYATLVALRKHASRHGFPFLGRIIAGLRDSFSHLYFNRRLIDEYLVIRYEDLVTATEPTMRAVAEHCALPFGEYMLTPTTLGENWSGNSTGGSVFSGISPAPLTAWQEQITPLEVMAINLIGSHICRDFDYRVRPDAKLSAWRPLSGESLRVFVANRLLLRMLQVGAP